LIIAVIQNRTNVKFAICELYIYICFVKRIVAKRTLVSFWEANPDSKNYLETWYETVRKANWKNPNEIKSFYATISILKNSRVVFNIKGHKYRLVAKINYQKSWLFIRFIGTHEDYDKIDANTI